MERIYLIEVRYVKNGRRRLYGKFISDDPTAVILSFPEDKYYFIVKPIID